MASRLSCLATAESVAPRKALSSCQQYFFCGVRSGSSSEDLIVCFSSAEIRDAAPLQRFEVVCIYLLIKKNHIFLYQVTLTGHQSEVKNGLAVTLYCKPVWTVSRQRIIIHTGGTQWHKYAITARLHQCGCGVFLCASADCDFPTPNTMFGTCVM